MSGLFDKSGEKQGEQNPKGKTNEATATPAPQGAKNEAVSGGGLDCGLDVTSSPRGQQSGDNSSALSPVAGSPGF
jgi:hypothetical protein